MNTTMRTCILACMSYLISCKQSLLTAAMKDDGTLSRDEAKTIRKFETLTDNYIKELRKLK